MKLKHQITLLVTAALLIPALFIAALSINQIKSKADADIEDYRKEELKKLKVYLKHITDIGYGMIEVEHLQMKEATTQDSSASFSELQLMDRCLSHLSQIRFDNGEGYFWVTDNKLPYPTMLMHAEKKNMKGKVLNDPKYNVEKNTGKNIYQVRTELSNQDGDAFVEYTMKKPGSDSVFNKISYSRLYKPLGWIISTGFYTDQIERSIAQKKADLSAQINKTILLIVGIGVLVSAIGLFVSNYFSRGLSNSIVLIHEKLKELSDGKQVEEAKSTRKDEVGEMTQSLNLLVNGLRTYTSFAKEIGKGNFDDSFNLLSKDDLLGSELLSMRDNLKLAEKEKNLREWSNEGFAKLSDVLRKHNTDTKQLTNEILKELVIYLRANQGAFFVIFDKSKEELEMVAAYAYGKQKFIKRTINIGDGMVGQCVLEKDTIYMSNVPNDYIKITSGLGEALPKSILLVPLMHADEVYGVIELASFNAFEAHQIAFIEKVAESIASTIASVQVNENTKDLLEKSQQMQEELRVQEEEVRQNMEELSATQEQMVRQAENNKLLIYDLELREKAFSLHHYILEVSASGSIVMVNDTFCMAMGYLKTELIGKAESSLLHPSSTADLLQKRLQSLKNGGIFEGKLAYQTKSGAPVWVEATSLSSLQEGHLHKIVSVMRPLDTAEAAALSS